VISKHTKQRVKSPSKPITGAASVFGIHSIGTKECNPPRRITNVAQIVHLAEWDTMNVSRFDAMRANADLVSPSARFEEHELEKLMRMSSHTSHDVVSVKRLHIDQHLRGVRIGDEAKWSRRRTTLKPFAFRY
jgi:hypothetical protein